MFAPHHRRAGLALVLTGAAALIITVTVMADTPAAGDESETELEPIGVLVPDEQLDPRILLLELDSAAYRRAIDRLEIGLFNREQTRRQLDQITATAGDLRNRSMVVARQMRETRSTIEAFSVELEEVRSELAIRAVERYVRHGADVDAKLDPVASINAGRGARLSAEVDQVQLARRSELLASIADADDRLGSLEAEGILTGVLLAVAQDRVERLALTLDGLDDDIDGAEHDVVVARRSARVPGAQISVIALDAYLDAESDLAESDPGCRLEWWMVAGVARVESRHGELGGRRLRADGRVDRPVIGIALDGGASVQLVADTDGGELDGDAEFDRAVGPFQFIPETWGRLGRDGNGDGVADPQNIYDAALAASTYLCRLASDLSDDGQLRSAYHGYNTSSEYVDAVHDHARRYSDLDLPNRR